MGMLWRTLRSRRVALWLIASVSVYVGLVTLVPQQAMSPDDHARWAQGGTALVSIARALGIDRAYTSPLFIVLVSALALSTAACSWERTRRALLAWRARGVVNERVLARLEASPQVVVTSPHAPSEAVDDAAAALRRVGLSVRRGPTLSFAEQNPWGLAGSPVFHWAMVALMVVIAVGQLTRWEGLLGVPQAAPVVEQAESYGRLDRGPLAPSHTGWRISLTSIRERMRIGDVEYGVTPRIALLDGDRVLAEQEVYPNNPLRYGPLLIHLSDHGLSVRVEVIGPDGASRGASDGLIDFSEDSSSGALPSGFRVTDDEGGFVADVDVSVNARDRRGALPRLKPPGEVITVRARTADGAAKSAVVSVGESMDLGAGWRVVVTDFGYYARLSVVRDWSVGWIYALLGIMIVGVSVALLAPYRCVWLSVRPAPDGGSVVSASVMHYRRDPLFLNAVRAALSDVEAGGADATRDDDEEMT